MKMLMISDLHIEDNSKDFFNKVFHRIDKMFEIINKEIQPTEKLIVVMCGDVVDCGKAEYYESAKIVFEYIKKKIGTRTVEFAMIPGNHDLCNDSFSDFDAFNLAYSNEVGEFEKASCWSKNIDKFNFILANSSYHKDTTYGKVEAYEIEKHVNPLMYNILVTHHSIISEDEDDSAAIRDIPRLLNVINENRILFHLHGHTHGTVIIRIGNDSRSLGVGSLFFKAAEMGSQFNLISVNDNKITSVINYIYRIDRDKYLPDEIELGNEEENLPLIIEQSEINFQRPENYISRLVGPFDIVQGGAISQYYNREKIKSLYEIVKENARIVLIGEAGNGKSCELLNLAYEIELNQKEIPVYVKLNDYVDESIVKLINHSEEEIAQGKYVLIFDGYDEIEESNLNKFARRLNAFVKKYPNQKIIVSTRNNFYKMSDVNTKVSTFYDFFECSLCPLSNEEICNFLEHKNVKNKEVFFQEIKTKNLSEQIKVPFFLVKITDLFIEEGKLPKQNEIMKQLILSRFEKDKSKYINTKDIDEQKKEIMALLKKLAFSMQCLRKNTILLDEYQELVDVKDRSLIKYCGIWKKSKEDKWEFEHNNFREYLAAEYINNFSLAKIKDLVTYKDNPSQIKESWVNVLSFLIMIYPEDTLANWIIDTNPSLAVKFEISRLGDDLRTRIFCNIMNRYKHANMWISREQNDEEELAKFGQNEKSIEYLIEEIKNPAHFRSQSNAIHILGKMTDYYGKEKEVKEVLFNCCISEKTRKYEMASVIMALMNKQLFSECDIDRLLNLFENENDSDIRHALYSYILEYKLQDKSIDFVLKGIKLSNTKYWDNFSEYKRLEDIIQSLKEYDSIIKVLEYILNAKDYYSVAMFFEESLDTICKIAMEFYNSGRKKILSYIQKIYYKAAVNFESKTIRILKNALESVNEIFSTYEWILNEQYPNDQNAFFVLEELMDEHCLDDLANKYQNDELIDSEIFISYVKRCRNNSYKYKQLKEIIFHKDGIYIEEREIIDYEAIRKEGEQRFFDSLFDKKIFQRLLEELAEKYNGQDTEYKDINNISFQRLEKRYDLDKVKWSIKDNSFKERRIVKFVSQANWEFFSMNNIYNELRNNDSINVNDEQKYYITQYCLRTIDNINLSKDIKYKKDGSVSFSWQCLWCAFFAQYFAIEYKEEKLLEMLVVPSFFFGQENNEDAFPSYITQRVDESKIKKEIIHNLNTNNKSIKGTLAETYIKYCTKNKIEEAYGLANEIVKDSEYTEWIRRQALEYIVDIKGYKLVIKNYLDDADKVLLDIIIESLYKYKDEQVINKMIECNKDSKDGVAYLKMLILSESPYGLQKYYTLAKEQNQIPDLGTDTNISELTEAIGDVSDVNNLDSVTNLAMLACCTDFKDKKYFGLRNSTYKSINNMAQENPELVINHLEKKSSSHKDDLEFVGFCNQLIDDIKFEMYNQKDLPWTLEEVKRYVQ